MVRLEILPYLGSPVVGELALEERLRGHLVGELATAGCLRGCEVSRSDGEVRRY